MTRRIPWRCEDCGNARLGARDDAPADAIERVTDGCPICDPGGMYGFDYTRSVSATPTEDGNE